MLKSTKRIISGIDNDKQSNILEETSIKPFIPYPQFPCFQIKELFYTEDSPQTLQTCNLEKPYDIQLPLNAMRFLILHMPTIQEMGEELEKAGQTIPSDWTKFNIHSTDSIDYVYIISGEIKYAVGEKVVQLKQGDFLTQIGPEHTWVNDSGHVCEILCVMVGIPSSGQRKKMEAVE